MTATAQRPGDGNERQFGWQDMFVGPDAGPRGIGGIFVHHGEERTVLAGYLDDYRGVHPNNSRWSPLTTVSTEPGLQAGSRDLP